MTCAFAASPVGRKTVCRFSAETRGSGSRTGQYEVSRLCSAGAAFGGIKKSSEANGACDFSHAARERGVVEGGAVEVLFKYLLSFHGGTADGKVHAARRESIHADGSKSRVETMGKKQLTVDTGAAGLVPGGNQASSTSGCPQGSSWNKSSAQVDRCCEFFMRSARETREGSKLDSQSTREDRVDYDVFEQ